MSRVIKFRAWVRDFERMVPVRTLEINNAGIKYVTLINIVPEPLSNHRQGKAWYSGVMRDKVSINHVELMQFTGLLDRNSVEIYEGDILTIVHPYKDRTYTGAVTYDRYAFTVNGFYFPHFDTPSDIFSEGTDYIEVIGNIYENGDLLK